MGDDGANDETGSPPAKEAVRRAPNAGATVVPGPAPTVFNVHIGQAAGVAIGDAATAEATSVAQVHTALGHGAPAEPAAHESDEAKYRSIVAGHAVIDVPGTSTVLPIDEDFHWPSATPYDRTIQPDFDDEPPRYRAGPRGHTIDLSLFPSPGLEHVVVVAGPGMGKSVLVRAGAARVANAGLLPVVIPIPTLSQVDVGIGEYLANRLNPGIEMKINWGVVADEGRLVLFLDGLDEVSAPRRATVLERIKTFCLRYPTVSSLLTVRDAAALAAPTAATLVELQPLDDTEIERLVRVYTRDDAAARLRFADITKRPDLLRLVRIPLFLALLLTSVDEREKLPGNRTELIESYLELLFRPEQFKPSELDEVDVPLLRRIAEDVAFTALEREEVGVSSRSLERRIQRIVPEQSVQPIIDKFLKCGVLRRPRLTWYEFPFPTVQEYLAARHLQARDADSVPGRLASASKRPWAQTLQFVLELHPSPEGLVEGLLALEDDVFNTNLRLVARCIANGMKLPSELREEIVRRLAGYWPTAPTSSRERVGALIAEICSFPLLPEVRSQLSHRWLLHDGAGAIVTRANDPALTRSVLRELLAGDTDRFLNLGELQHAVSDLGDEALRLYAEHESRDGEATPLSALIGHLDGKRISTAARDEVVNNETLPTAVRLAALALGPAPLDARAQPLVDVALGLNGFEPRSTAVHAIAKMEDPTTGIREALLRDDLSMNVKLELLGYLTEHLDKEQLRRVFQQLAHDTAFSEELRLRLLVFAAGYGNESAFATLVASIDTLPVEVVCPTIGLFGHYPSTSLVETAVERLRSGHTAASDRARLISSAVIGMTYVYDMDWFDAGLLNPAPPHPGLSAMRTLLEDWAAANEYSPTNALGIDQDLVRIGSEPALARLPARIAALLGEEWPEGSEYNYTTNIGSAISTLREWQQLLPIATLETVIERCSFNGAARAVDMIAAHATSDALDSLLLLYESVEDYYMRDVVLKALETLTGRLGLRLRLVGSKLETTTD